MRLTVTRMIEDQGSVVVFEGDNEVGPTTTHLFAADWRPAQDIVAALERGEEPQVDVENWQLL